MALETTELVKDFVATRLLSKVELDFLEAELWEIIQHIEELTSLSIAPEDIAKELGLESGSSWQLCCAAVLDTARPTKKLRTDQLRKVIEEFSLI
tara:strand:- start:110 stop:394 length:285 start_codon:yes stop_codon:yes gene_type:complete